VAARQAKAPRPSRDRRSCCGTHPPTSALKPPEREGVQGSCRVEGPAPAWEGQEETRRLVGSRAEAAWGGETGKAGLGPLLRVTSEGGLGAPPPLLRDGPSILGSAGRVRGARAGSALLQEPAAELEGLVEQLRVDAVDVAGDSRHEHRALD